MMMNPGNPMSVALRALACRLGADRRGATAIEYGLILALMTLAMLVAFTSVANSTTGMWNMVSDKVTRAQ